MQPVSAPLFDMGGNRQLSAYDGHVREGYLGTSFVLSGPGATAEAGHLPVRGDLAHINLAGRYFVPHYAVPMPRRVVSKGAVLRRTASTEAEAVEQLAGDTTFNVLDIVAQWAWGQVGEDGFVGYLPVDSLEERRS